MTNAQIILANPRGFCAGVDRAVDIVERALELLDCTIYVRHEIVHNRYVVEDLQRKGVIFVNELCDVPDGGTVVFSAHGVAASVHEEAKRRNLTVFDATCPLVTKVHMEVIRAAKESHECILIGHRGHPEVIGTMGQYHHPDRSIYLVETLEDAETIAVDDPTRLSFVTQTTLSIDETKMIIATLMRRFPLIQGLKRDDICYATQNRQNAVRELAKSVDVVLVVGSPNSSNSNRLRELAESLCGRAYLLDSADSVLPEWIAGAKAIGLTAGASAPEVLLQQVIVRLKALGAGNVVEMAEPREDIVFPLPKLLRELEK